MPEIPEVEAARCECQDRIGGKIITDIHVVRDRQVFDDVAPDRFASALRRRRVEAVARKGKYLWFVLDHRPWPVFHFGMTGRFEYYGQTRERPEHWKAEILLADGPRLAVVSVRRLGRILLQDDPPGEPPVSELGADAVFPHRTTSA